MNTPEAFYAWITPVPTPGIIATAVFGIGDVTPLATTRHDLALKMQPLAESHASGTGEPVELVRYDRAEVLAHLEPNA